jgi:hypothetical protein
MLFEEVRTRLYARAGGALHIGAPPLHDPAPGFATLKTPALTSFHNYRGKSMLSELNTQIASQCCAFIDQHEIDYVLWDRRAYTRDWMIRVSAP